MARGPSATHPLPYQYNHHIYQCHTMNMSSQLHHHHHQQQPPSPDNGMDIESGPRNEHVRPSHPARSSSTFAPQSNGGAPTTTVTSTVPNVPPVAPGHVFPGAPTLPTGRLYSHPVELMPLPPLIPPSASSAKHPRLSRMWLALRRFFYFYFLQFFRIVFCALFVLYWFSVESNVATWRTNAQADELGSRRSIEEIGGDHYRATTLILKDVGHEWFGLAEGDDWVVWDNFVNGFLASSMGCCLILLLIRKDFMRLTEWICAAVSLHALSGIALMVTTYPDPWGSWTACQNADLRSFGGWIFGRLSFTYCGAKMFSGHTFNMLTAWIIMRRTVYEWIGWSTIPLTTFAHRTIEKEERMRAQTMMEAELMAIMMQQQSMKAARNEQSLYPSKTNIVPGNGGILAHHDMAATGFDTHTAVTRTPTPQHVRIHLEPDGDDSDEIAVQMELGEAGAAARRRDIDSRVQTRMESKDIGAHEILKDNQLDHQQTFGKLDSTSHLHPFSSYSTTSTIPTVIHPSHLRFNLISPLSLSPSWTRPHSAAGYVASSRLFSDLSRMDLSQHVWVLNGMARHRIIASGQGGEETDTNRPIPSWIHRHRLAFIIATSIIRLLIIASLFVFVVGILRIRRHYSADVWIAIVVSTLLCTNEKYLQTLVAIFYRPVDARYADAPIYPFSMHAAEYQERLSKVGVGGLI